MFEGAKVPPSEVEDDEQEAPNLSLFLSVSVELVAELGQVDMSVEQVLGIVPGAIFGLEASADEPIHLIINGRKVGSGEVVVFEEKFGVLVTSMGNASSGQNESKGFAPLPTLVVEQPKSTYATALTG